MNALTMYFYIRLFGGLMATLPMQMYYRVMRRSLSEKQRVDFVTNVGRRLASKYLRITRASFHVHGLERIPEGAVLFAANHQSYFDLAVFLCHIPKPKGYMAKASLEKIPVLKYWMHEIKCILIERSDPKRAARALSEAIRTLKGGHSLVIFPEGTRSPGGVMGEFKGGTLKIASKARVPIVPVSIDGTFRILEANGGNIKRGVQVNVYIHDPIPTADLSKEELEALSGSIRAIIASKLPEAGPVEG